MEGQAIQHLLATRPTITEHWLSDNIDEKWNYTTLDFKF
jgi:hypothetical protein